MPAGVAGRPGRPPPPPCRTPPSKRSSSSPVGGRPQAVDCDPLGEGPGASARILARRAGRMPIQRARGHQRLAHSLGRAQQLLGVAVQHAQPDGVVVETVRAWVGQEPARDPQALAAQQVGVDVLHLPARQPSHALVRGGLGRRRRHRPGWGRRGSRPRAPASSGAPLAAAGERHHQAGQHQRHVPAVWARRLCSGGQHTHDARPGPSVSQGGNYLAARAARAIAPLDVARLRVCGVGGCAGSCTGVR